MLCGSLAGCLLAGRRLAGRGSRGVCFARGRHARTRRPTHGGGEMAAVMIGVDPAKRWHERSWAVEGAAGVGVQLAQRLVADGETVLDVPPKLSTRARIFDVGHGRKNDPGDARTVAVVAIRTSGLRWVVPDDEMVALRLLSERRRDLVRSRTQTVNHLHQLLMGAHPRR